jgi:4'-phosphopantetheinyl transferase
VTDLLVLSTDELERAQRLPDDRVRGRWVASRAFLRRTLAPLTGADPADLVFDYGDAGKPSLPGGPEFSLAHSGDYALLAFAAVPVGVDLEQVRPGLAALPSVERFFSAAERTELDALPEPRRVAHFFELWTLKEAYLKATGEGLARRSLGALPVGGWISERPPAPPGYAAAVVVLAERAVFDFS